ncbi:MAG: hypothetical protein ACO1O4_05795 [Devosia sp.]
MRELDGRYVYVIETPKSLPIRYDEGISNVCYIGRQGVRSSGGRLLTHAKGWIARYLILSSTAEHFKIHYCHPRRRNMADAYKDIEAFVINEFAEQFGSAPIFNKRKEAEFGKHQVALNAKFFKPRHKNTRWKIDARNRVEAAVIEGFGEL